MSRIQVTKRCLRLASCYAIAKVLLHCTYECNNMVSPDMCRYFNGIVLLFLKCSCEFPRIEIKVFAVLGILYNFLIKHSEHSTNLRKAGKNIFVKN